MFNYSASSYVQWKGKKKNRLSATFVIEHSIGTMRIVAQLIFNGMNSFMSSEIHFVFITFLKI